MVNNVVSRAAFGFKCNDQDEFMSLLSEVKKKFFTLPDLFPSLGFLRYITGVQATLESLHRKQDKLLDRIINEHKMKGKSNGKKSDHDDLLDVLLKLQESDQLDMHLTTNQIKAVTMVFTAIGNTNTDIIILISFM
ncbi:unnamed protein product [Dovyalis caffra]|uniref:Cytochrome P450 n=1 Tax=Dovyalis caffra TaxID=77055 RepID=A0AAV1SFZ3_9ROSI|nr:unnamed protein product [Dovyalis caffra]